MDNKLTYTHHGTLLSVEKKWMITSQKHPVAFRCVRIREKKPLSKSYRV